MTENEERREPRVQAGDDSVAVGSLRVDGSVDGSLIIGSHNVVGFTSEQVSTLITQISTAFQPKPFDGHSPYKGLDVFEEEDAEMFFGREKLVEDLVIRLKESRTVFVTGPSGSGKSSLVRAGLIHALKQGAIKDANSERWLYASLKPGRDPIESLANAFSRLKSPDLGNYFRGHADSASALNECAESALTERQNQRFVLFVDQFEEIFTQLNRAKAEMFIQLLDCAATTENGRVILLFAMRSDFISNCATFPRLNALLNQQFVQIGAMQPEELVSAIAQPALQVGLRIDPELVAQIINDMKGEPGSLPLMQFALKDLFDSQQAQGNLIDLNLKDYLERGGIRKALERHADNSFNRLDVHEQELARSIFTGLIEIGRGTQDTRRTAIFDELIPANTSVADVQVIIQKLSDARLITTDEVGGKDTVTISHEKLIDAWPWLKKLVNENRDVIALQNEIAEDAKEWDENQRDPSYLYSGARLHLAQEKVATQKIVLSGLAKNFIEEGITVQEAERKAKETLRRRIFSGLIAGIAIAILLAGFAVVQMLKAQEQTRIARSGELSAQSIALRDKNLSVALLLGIEAFRKHPAPQSEGVLLDNVQVNPFLHQFLPLHQDQVFTVAFSPDGKMVASGSRDKSIILWDVKSHQPIGEPFKGHSESVLSVAFSPDGSLLASGGGDKTVILWDVKSHQPIAPSLSGHAGRVYSVAFSPDGKMLASGSQDQTIILWDVKTRQSIAPALKSNYGVITVAFSPNGKLLASGGESKTIILWDVATHQPVDPPLQGDMGTVTTVAFSRDGRILASGGADNTITLWDVETHHPIDKLSGHEEYITSLAFSPDGKRLVSGSVDGAVLLWSVESHKLLSKLLGHAGWVRTVSFSPDGGTIASGGIDNMVILWDLKRKSPLGQFFLGHTAAVYSVASSPDGETIASGSGDGAILLWNVKTGQSNNLALNGSHGTVICLAFSPDGKILASGYQDGSIVLWDMDSHQSSDPPLAGHSKSVYSVAFSLDGKLLASGSLDHSISLWDVGSRQLIGQLNGHTGAVNSVAFSPDGNLLASGSEDTTIILWDLKSRQAAGKPLTAHKGIVYSIAFSPDGKILASGSADSKIILWDVNTHQPLVAPLISQNGFIYSIAFSPDGKTLASGGYKNSIQLWDVESKESPVQIGEPLVDKTLTISSLAFRPDGKSLISGSADNSVILWDLDPKLWIEKICERVGRNLSDDEWTQYFPNEKYRATCPQ